MNPASHAISLWLFPKLLAVVYLLAFASLLPQVRGLFGSRGILPVRDYLAAVGAELGRRRYAFAPTLFWLRSSDAFLCAIPLLGMLAALLLAAGIGPPALLLALLWLLYLSIASVGQEFLSYQWDALLLESGFMTIFLPLATPAPPLVAIAYWFFLFRFIFSSGVVKLTSGDPTWRGLTAMAWHYETQPLPNRLAWYAHQLSRPLQRLSTLGTFFFELAVPLLALGPAPVRLAGGLLLLLFQGLIFLTGNYGFFNILTAVLIVPLFADRYLELLPGLQAIPLPAPGSPVAAGVVSAIFAVFLLLNAGQLLLLFVRPPWLRRLYGRLAPLMISNHYGLFSVMTTVRYEFAIEGSNDLASWQAYEFRWKPGDPRRPPRQAAPHQPRLDWQMWFAALNPEFVEPWLQVLVRRILEGSPQVLPLLGRNPFPEAPPAYLRLTVYRYRFTDRVERRRSGEWWARNLYGTTRPMTLHGGKPPQEGA